MPIERIDRGHSERGDVVIDDDLRVAGQIAMLAAGRAPHERTVARVELLDAMLRLDHLRPRHAEPAFLGHHERVAARGDEAHAAEAADAAADEADHRDAGRARVEQRAHRLGDRDQAGVRLVQPHAARLEQQHDRHRSTLRRLIDRALEEPGQLRSVDLADRAAHEAAFLRRDQHAAAAERRRAHDDAVVERHRRVEQRQVRARRTRGRRQQLAERAGVDQRGDPLARVRLVEAVLDDGRLHRSRGARNSSTAWSSRRLTTAGVAPTSLIEMRTPPSSRPREEVGEHRGPHVVEAARRRHHVDRAAVAAGCRLDHHLEVAGRDDADDDRLVRLAFAAVVVEGQVFHRIASEASQAPCACGVQPKRASNAAR